MYQKMATFFFSRSFKSDSRLVFGEQVGPLSYLMVENNTFFEKSHSDMLQSVATKPLIRETKTCIDFINSLKFPHFPGC